MIKINLVSEAPTAVATKRKRSDVSVGVKQGDLILMVVLAICAAVVGGQWYLLSSKKADLQKTENARRAERDELQEFIRRVDELERTRESLRHKIQVINDLKLNQRGPVRIMDEVSRALPDLVWLSSLDLKDNVITLNGVAMDENAVANYIANLDASPFFQEPTLKNMSRRPQSTFAFVLTCVFTYSPQAIAGGENAGTGV
ncbi:MAG: hypothetical protein GY906_17420 [bacterium]|nr:hypothetical protein [bacterium]